MPRLASLASAAFALFVTLASCGGENKLGEECDESGADGECESNGVCGKNAAGALLCLKVCTDQAQCAATEDCNGVDGSNIKGCRPKDGAKK